VSSASSEYEVLTLKAILSNYKCFICLLSATLSVVFALYLDVMLAVALVNRFNLNQNLVGVYFALASITYIIGAPLAAYLSSYINRRYIVLFAFILMTMQSFLSGPSELLNFPNHIALVTLGVSMMGISLAMGIVPLLSELI
jgi:MFS family permease